MLEKQKLTTVTRDLLEKAKTDLQRMAETRKPSASIPQRLTRPQFVRALRAKLQAAFKRGYDVVDMVAFISDLGIAMDPVTFRRCWRQARKVRQVRAALQADNGSVPTDTDGLRAKERTKR
jgi:hypothetical protein